MNTGSANDSGFGGMSAGNQSPWGSPPDTPNSGGGSWSGASSPGSDGSSTDASNALSPGWSPGGALSPRDALSPDAGQSTSPGGFSPGGLMQGSAPSGVSPGVPPSPSPTPAASPQSPWSPGSAGGSASPPFSPWGSGQSSPAGPASPTGPASPFGGLGSELGQGGLGQGSPASSPRSNVSSEFAAQYAPGGCATCGGSAAPAVDYSGPVSHPERSPELGDAHDHPGLLAELGDAHDEISDLFRRIQSRTDQQFAQVARSRPAQGAQHPDFKDVMQRIGEDWERQIADQALQKLHGALGQSGPADDQKSQQLRANVHRLFWILWTRSALFYLKCQLGLPLNSAGLHGGAFDTNDPSMLRHMEGHHAEHLDQHPHAGAGHDLVLLAQDVMPDEVNAALSVAWSILNANGSAPHADDHNLQTLFGAGSMSVIQAILGFISQVLVCHRTATDQQGARANPLARDLDRSFANFLGMCGRRALELSASACVASMANDGPPGGTPHGSA